MCPYFSVYYINVTFSNVCKCSISGLHNVPVAASLPLTASRGVHGYSQGGKFGILRRKDCGDAAGSPPSASLTL